MGQARNPRQVQTKGPLKPAQRKQLELINQLDQRVVDGLLQYRNKAAALQRAPLFVFTDAKRIVNYNCTTN